MTTRELIPFVGGTVSGFLARRYVIRHALTGWRRHLAVWGPPFAIVALCELVSAVQAGQPLF